MTTVEYNEMMAKNKKKAEHWANILDNNKLLDLLIGEARREQRAMSKESSDEWDNAIDMVNRLKEVVLARMN